MKKKQIFLLSVFVSSLSLLCACSSDPIPEEPVDETPDGYVDVLPENNEGNILQAFSWTFKQITENIPAIVDAGFKVVQTSPVQQPKNGGSSWWAFYQPLSFSIADNSSLGTKDDLKELCEVAEQHGVAVICDIVFNHLANISDQDLEADGTPKVSPAVEEYEPEIYQHRNDSGATATFHHNPHASGSGAVTQVYSYGHLPDLNTANPVVQGRCLDLLKECIDVGVDGFRFDAAKHIETPNDPQYASDFWPNTLGEAKKYYTEKTGKELIAYGEILNDVDGGRSISDYTQFMKVTDNTYISDIYASIISKKYEKTLNASYGKNTSPENLVTWAESHDTYVDTSSHIGDTKLGKEWAVISSRKNTVSMFLARPDANASVGKVNSYYFENIGVAAINRFHNRFIHHDEKQSLIEDIYINERFNTNDAEVGAMLVNLSSNPGEREITFEHLGTAVYYDQITGEAITVRDNKAKITFPQNGLVILTKSKNLARPYLDISNRGGVFASSTSVNVSVFNNTEAYYTINGGEQVAINNSATISIGNKVDENNFVKVKIVVKNSQFSIERTFIYQKINLIPGYFNVVNLKPSYFDDYEIYIWHWSKGKDGTWAKNYSFEDGIMLVDFTDLDSTSFLFATFPKGYTVTIPNVWDKNFIKQSADINISDNYYDASNF